MSGHGTPLLVEGGGRSHRYAGGMDVCRLAGTLRAVVWTALDLGVCVRTISTAMTAVLAGLFLGTAVTGCTGEGQEKALSADELLDEAHETMSALGTVTVTSSTTAAAGNSYSSRLTTDLEGRCANRITWDDGGRFEQVRIDDTDYVRPNRVYLEKWSGRKTAGAGAKDQSRWIKTPAGNAKPGDGLVDCTWPFSAFGTPAKGEPTEVGGRRAVPLKVTDPADKGEGKGTYTFYVATEGKPYLLEVVYKGTDFRSTTSFSAFDEPLDVRAPAEDEVLDAG
ncbi:MAG TPA: hypothetical protein VN520_35675 [Streptomyces sp.]|uniref:hypothetical protein n=1 Tax=Streptomyces sp. TaxID=1931 RepID=UPI002B619D88|nr:hypothetical protein [Streptomyces sp.]HWU11633.1 hypothetical protein [Streptomyces sp.]